MASYVYDEYRLTLTPRADGDYDAVGRGADGIEQRCTFRLPFDDRELEQRVLGVAQRTTRSGTRDIGGDVQPEVDAEALGGALATALLAGDVAAGYDAARRAAGAAGRGLRLTLSLGAAPALLSVPWELLYRPPTFLANQRQSPVVRHLDVPGTADPPAIDGTVRILGVVANPADTAPLDVAAERDRVERAVADVVARGLVTLDWLEPATPRRLREVLRDGSYHVLHYIGHGDFTSDGDGVLYLEAGDDDAAGGHAELDRNELASLLADQASLRLVVLNACDGARTTLTDPFAGVATTLVQLGVPAVVAMQFAISDAAAILFAEELYTNLVGRSAPIDAAVSEARKAIFIEQGTVEWATPVLFMAATDVELWRPASPPPLPPPPPADATAPATVNAPIDVTVAPDNRPRRPRRLAGVVAGAVLLAAAVVVWAVLRPGDDPDAGADPQSSTTLAAPAPPSAPVSSPPGSAPAAPGAVGAQTFSGSIDVADEADPYPFEAVAGQALYLHGTTPCGPSVEYRLFGPSGTQYGGNPYVCQDLGRFDLAESGTWTLQAASYAGGTGAYAIELTPITADTDETIALGQRMRGEITQRGEQRRYHFTAAAGEIVYIDAGPRDPTATCPSVAYELLSPDESQLAGYPYACNDTDRVTVPAAGEYTISVESYQGGFGTYDLTLLGVPPVASTPIAIGSEVSGDITAPGQVLRYPFDAVARTVVAVDGRGPCGPEVEYWIESPSGVVVGGKPYVCNDLPPQELAEDGTFTLVVASWTGGIGTFDLLLHAVS